MTWKAATGHVSQTATGAEKVGDLGWWMTECLCISISSLAVHRVSSNSILLLSSGPTDLLTMLHALGAAKNKVNKDAE